MCSSLSLSQAIFRVDLDLQIGGILRAKRYLDSLMLPLGSGVISYWLHKVHLSICSSFPIGIESFDMHHNF